MAAHEFWNPLQSYKKYKQSEYVYISNGIDDDIIDVPQSSFEAKLKGTFFIFAGYLSDPDHTDMQITTTDDSNEEEIEIHKINGTNHAGLYDYLTLGIPGAIEAFFRGNFLESKQAQNICQTIFTIIPIVPVLATIRNSFGVIATIVSFFPVAFIHLCEKAWNAWNTSEEGLQKAVIEDRSTDDTGEFLKNYKELSSLFRNNNHELNTVEKKELLKRSGSLLEAATFFSGRIPDSNRNNPDLKLNKRLNKIAANGEYSEQEIEKKFGHSI